MRISGIAACILAVAAFAPCHATGVTIGGGAAAHSPASALTKAVKPKKAEQPPQQAYITFYWAKGSDSASMFNVFREKLLISMDGKQAGKLVEGEYLAIPVDAGHHTYGYERVAVSSEGETKREIDVAAGQTAYFEIVDKDAAGFVHTIVPQAAEPGKAKADMVALSAPAQAATKEAVLGGAQSGPGKPGAPVAGGGLPARAPPAVPGGPVEVSAAAPVTGKPGKPGKKGAAPPAPAQSFVTFYWPKRTSGTVAFMETLGERFGISVDGHPMGSIAEGEYIAVPVQPGAHNYAYAKATQISIGQKQRPIDVPAGESLYFEIVEEQQGMISVSFPQQVPAEQGKQALAGLKAPSVND